MIELTALMIAEERQRALCAEARRRALVRLASCCRPTALRRALATWQERSRPAATCCA